MRSQSAPQWDWISAGLVFLLLQMPAARLVASEWAPFLYWAETMAGLGTMLGLALGVSKFTSRSAALLALAYTIFVPPWQLTMYFKDKLLLDRLGSLVSTLGASFQQFFQRQPVKDPLFFLLGVCLAFWVIGLVSGYALSRRRRVLGCIVMAGAALVIIQAYGNYQPRGSWWLASFALLAVMLASRVHFLDSQTTWAKRRVFVGEDSGGNIMAGMVATAGLAILAAWWLPAVPGSVRRAAETWNHYVEPIRERLSNAVTSLRGPYGKPGDNFYGGVLPLGQNAATGDQVVLRVEVLESPGVNMRYYWRGRTYSDYSNGAWSASAPAKLLFHSDDQDIAVPYASGRSEGLFRVTSEFPIQSLIYGPSPAIWLDRTADVSAVRAAPGAYDVLAWVARLPVAQGSDYQVRSTLRNPTVVELREASEAYPGWVTSGYLGVPDRYRERLTQLAQEITRGQSSVYDKAAAVTSYLRFNISYASSVPTIPEGEDPVLWVLFEHKQGYCNYYASAEVLLLRSIGIPARLAVGFARGEFLEGGYTVHRRDAHAWPEVYFPEIGWVEFEPTANQAPLTRPRGVDVAVGALSPTLGRGGGVENTERIPEDVELAPPAVPLPFWLTPGGRAVRIGGPILLALTALAFAYRLRVWNRLPSYAARNIEAGGGLVPAWLRQWAGWYELQPVERAFAIVGWTLRLLGRPQALDATPAAQTAVLSQLVPSAAVHLRILQNELERGLYSRQIPDNSRARQASFRVLLHGLRARLQATMARLNGSAVYSGTDLPYRTRGTR